MKIKIQFLTKQRIQFEPIISSFKIMSSMSNF